MIFYSTKGQWLKTFGKAVLPALSVFIAQIMPVLFVGWTGYMPWLGLAVFFFWVLFKVESMPLWVCFLLGMFEDTLRTQPIGMYALFYLLVRQLLDAQHHFLMRRSFYVVWFAFGLMVFMLILLEGILMQQILHISGLELYLLRFVSTVLCFPLVFITLSYLQRHLLEDEL